MVTNSKIIEAQEPRLLTHLANEGKLRDIFEHGLDPYASISSLVFKKDYWECMEHHQDGTPNPDGKALRKKAKTILLGVMYGMGAKLMSKNLGTPIEECKEILEEFFTKFSDIKKFTEYNEWAAKQVGYVEDYMGRRRHLKDAKLDELEFRATKDIFTDCEIFPDCNSSDNKISVPDEDANRKWKRLWESDYKGKGYNVKAEFKEMAKEAGVATFDNGAFISKTLTQCTNARIQGCLSGDVRVQTKQFGIKKLKDLSGQTITLWDGYDWTSGLVIDSGKKQKCIIHFTDGSSIVCSPNHKFNVIYADCSEKFKECKDIKHYDRVLISSSYAKSDYVYESFKRSSSNNANSYYLDDIVKSKSSFDAGRFIGRLASDGSFGVRNDGGSCFNLMVAEHEFDILPILKSYVQCWPKSTVKVYDVRNNRTQRMASIGATSFSLMSELKNLDIKHMVDDNIFMDTDLLRGFISGFYDGDGGISGNNITLTFGTQYNFEPMIRDIQIALKFFGIRSRYKHYNYCYKLSILRADSIKFSKIIGFINSEKQKLSENMHICKDLHCFGKKSYVIVDYVEITDEYVDMYDVCDTDRGYFVADGLITHNSAASLTKKAMVNIYNDKRLNELGFKLLIPIHDELLGECPEEYAQEVSERLSQVMIDAAKPECSVAMKCDPYVVKRWYADELANIVEDDFYKLTKEQGKTEEEAVDILCKENCELHREVVEQMCHGTYDVLSGAI